MSNTFLLSSEIDVSNGTTNLFGATIGSANLLTNYPIKTNSTKQLVSTKLDISDINNLQSSLDNGIRILVYLRQQIIKHLLMLRLIQI